MSSTAFDFKKKSQALIQQIEQQIKNPMTRELGRIAVEVALREAYEQGAKDVKNAKGKPSLTSATTSKSATTKKPPAALTSRSSSSATSSDIVHCSHKWDEAFLEGRSVGFQCTECGVLQKDIKNECDHFFVKSGNVEICVACRKQKGR